MSIIKTGIAAHDTTANLAEMTREVADDKARATYLAAGGGPTAWPAYDAAVQANTVTYLRAVISSAISNGLQYTPYSEALHRMTGSYS